MDKKKLITRIQAHAAYLRQTRLSLGEVDAINHILKCADSLDIIAKELGEDETDNEQE